jgi:hypothetical protein
MRKAGLFLAFGFAAACASTSSQGDHAYAQHTSTTTEPTGHDKMWISTHSDGSEAGRITGVQGQNLWIAPYTGAAAQSLAFKVDRRFPVFAGAQPSTQALTAGQDVRVYYRGRGNDKPEVVGVELLSPDDVRELQSGGTEQMPNAAAPQHFPSDDESPSPSQE